MSLAGSKVDIDMEAPYLRIMDDTSKNVWYNYNIL